MQSKLRHPDNRFFLIYNFLSGRSSAGQVKKLINWVEKDPGNLRLFLLYRDIWIATGINAPSSLYGNRSAWINTNASPEKMVYGRDIPFALYGGHEEIQYKTNGMPILKLNKIFRRNGLRKTLEINY